MRLRAGVWLGLGRTVFSTIYIYIHTNYSIHINIPTVTLAHKNHAESWAHHEIRFATLFTVHQNEAMLSSLAEEKAH